MKKIFSRLFLAYLSFFAKLQLRKIKPIVIGIGGASGKSSVAKLSYEILSKKYAVLESGGKNSETGIPLSILDLDNKDYSYKGWVKILFLTPLKFFTNNRKYDYFVCEMGIDSPYPPKNMKYLLDMVSPDIGILTNIDIEHSVYFDELVSVTDEKQRKTELLNLLAKEEGLLLKNSKIRAIANIDDPYIASLIPVKADTLTVSAKDKNADFYISSCRVDLQSFEIEFMFLNEKYSVKVNQPLPKYYMYSFVQVLALSFSCGVNLKDSIDYLSQSFSLPPGRFSVFKGIKNSTVFDSSYNSSLLPAVGAIELLNNLNLSRRKVGVLGDMRELGSIAKLQHEELAKVINKNLDFAVLLGPNMKEYVAPIFDSSNFKYVWFESFNKLKQELPNLIREKDLILVKGSQNTLFLERAVELLLAQKSDISSLTRRGEFWQKARNKSN